jgi:aryl-alcohol dehydrogenase-like predicted oxidoreductase
MDYRVLGADGPKVPVLGFGAWPIGGGMGAVDEANAIATIHSAIDNGITLIDTAQAYRSSEDIIGKALKGGYRQRCFLATKVSFSYSREAILSAIDNSLRALQTDHVDLYQIHGWNPAYPIEESMETLAGLQKAGKARYLGVSNFNAAQMAQALQTTPYHSNQVPYNFFQRQIETADIPFCERSGIGILAHSPLAKGLLTGTYAPGYVFPAADERANMPNFQGETFARYLARADQLKQIAAGKGLTLVQMAIAWLLRLPAVTCVLVGAKNPAQVQEHLGAVGVTFAEDELAQIEAILAGQG